MNQAGREEQVVKDFFSTSTLFLRLGLMAGFVAVAADSELVGFSLSPPPSTATTIHLRPDDVIRVVTDGIVLSAVLALGIFMRPLDDVRDTLRSTLGRPRSRNPFYYGIVVVSCTRVAWALVEVGLRFRAGVNGLLWATSIAATISHVFLHATAWALTRPMPSEGTWSARYPTYSVRELTL